MKIVKHFNIYPLRSLLQQLYQRNALGVIPRKQAKSYFRHMTLNPPRSPFDFPQTDNRRGLIQYANSDTFAIMLLFDQLPHPRFLHALR
ncbi:hypothetical protein PF70_03506 [Pseudomonas asplenii]|nr:hypothetical protein PF70_03506 [Pseudomonas fuscovaginae]